LVSRPLITDDKRYHPAGHAGGRVPRPRRRPWGGHWAVFNAAGTLNREDWGLTWNLPLDGGGLLVSREIRIEIELEAVLQP
jgi:YceI-like protein